MKKFKQIYDEELKKQEDEPFFHAMLNHSETRAFAYEVCKRIHCSDTYDYSAPTREEWEAFADNLADAICFEFENRRQYIKRAVLSMPIVPRGK